MWIVRRDDLSAEFVRSILDYDPETGEFRWKYRSDYSKAWNTRRAGKLAGGISEKNGSPYWTIRIGNHDLFLGHRLAWVHHYGEWPEENVDHIDGNTLNNRIINLRPCNQSQNGANRGAQKNNTSGYKGVHFDKQTGRWRARIKADGRYYELGRFATLEEAAAAYREAAERLHGQFARVG